MPASVFSRSELEELASRATTFAEDHLEAWPDIDAYVADYTDDYMFADPTWSDYRVGSAGFVTMLQLWESMTDYTIDVTAEYVSADGTAFEETWPGLQPPMPLPPNPPVASGLEIFSFADDRVASNDLWYRAEDDVAYRIGCFAVNSCPSLQGTVDPYVAAWTERDPDAIASLYHEEATFSDSLLGLDATGRDAIADLSDQRFGSADDLSIEVLDLYAWTAGTAVPTDSNPEAGRLIGIAIHYRATRKGTAEMQEAVATLELGIKTATGIEADTDGLIHAEDVYHSIENLPDPAR